MRSGRSLWPDRPITVVTDHQCDPATWAGCLGKILPKIWTNKAWRRPCRAPDPHMPCGGEIPRTSVFGKCCVLYMNFLGPPGAISIGMALKVPCGITDLVLFDLVFLKFI